VKRKGRVWLRVGAVVATAAVAHVLLSSFPNRDDAAAEVIQRSGGEVRRTPRLLWLAVITDASDAFYPRGDVWAVELRDAEIGSEVAERLSALRSLSDLDVYRCRVPAGMATSLIPPSGELLRVYISSTNVGDRHISTLEHCPNLRSLTLKGTDISDASVAAIVQCRKLGSIVLRGNKLTDAGIAAIRAALPGANVVTE
jgi:hypothetical protein